MPFCSTTSRFCKWPPLVLGAALAPAAAMAQPASGDSEIVVVASGIGQPRDQAGQSISVLDREAIASRQQPLLSDVLATLPGVSLARSGGPGTATSLFIRGANSGQTLVLVDGVRVNDPSSPSGAFDFAGLLSAQVERVELLRGPNSVIWGSNAIGGIVNIETRAPTGDLSVSGGAEYGRYDSFAADAAVSGTSGGIAASLAASYLQTDGFSALRLGSDRDAGERDGYRNASLSGRVEATLAPGLVLDLRGTFIDTQVDYDDSFAFPGAPANSRPASDNRFVFAYAGLDFELDEGRTLGTLSYQRTDVERIGTDADSVAPSFNDFDAQGSIDRVSLRLAVRAAAPLTLVLGADREEQRADIYFPANGPGRTPIGYGQTSAYAQAVLRAADGLTVTAGVRHDDHEEFGGNTSLGANFAWSPDGGDTVMRATYAEGFRAPSLDEQLGQFGNPALGPETAQSVDAGIEHRFLGGAARVSATWFRRDTEGLIVFSADSFTLENIARARAEGLELTLALAPTQRLAVSAQYSLIDTTNLSRALDFSGNSAFGNALARRPRHNATLVVDWKGPRDLALGATIRISGDSFDDNANAVRLDGYSTLDVRAALPLGDHLTVQGRVENLFDADYQTVAGYNVGGIAAHAGVRLRL